MKLRPTAKSIKLQPSLLDKLKMYGILRYRGKRAGQRRYKIKTIITNRLEMDFKTSRLYANFNGLHETEFKIPRHYANYSGLHGPSGTATRNPSNLIAVKINKSGPPKRQKIPSCMVLNARSIVKADAAPALHAELHSKNIDICFISETWLTAKVNSNLVCPNGYTMLRKDRSDSRNGGGVAIVCRNDWKISHINYDNNLECLWCIINTANSKYYAGVVYHPPDPIYNDEDLLNHLTECCETILSTETDAKIIIAGDINKLNIRDLISQHNLVQMIKKPTRCERILDVFLTNRPHLWKPSPVVFKGLIRSDHMAIVVSPQTMSKPVRKTVYIRDVREHRKLAMDHMLEEWNWSDVLNCESIDDMIDRLNYDLLNLMNTCFPIIKVKTSSRDPPFMSPLIKRLCNIRNKYIRKNKYVENIELQDRINKLIREYQVCAVEKENRKHNSGSKQWWNTVNKITGRKLDDQHISSIIDPELINTYFQEINTDQHFIAPDLLPIPDGTRIPILDVNTVRNFMLHLKCTAVGPDDLPHWLWKEFAHHLAPVITKVFNQSLCQHTVPSAWKTANIRPIPKESPLTACNQLRPISLTSIIMRLFERLVLKQEMSSILKSVIKADQFAFKEGCNTTMALLRSQHYWLKALDGEADHVRVLSFDFSKAFDTVSHKIISEKLKYTKLNPYIINWVISFLSNRKQRVVVDGFTTNYLSINRGVPQGTVLGPILFSLMVNDICAADGKNNLLIKFADDITVTVPVRNGKDSASSEVNNIKDWGKKNYMSLNLTKTWEMVIHGKTSKPKPQPLQDIKRKESLKLLGITFQNKPTSWNIHIDNMLSKASSRLYIIRNCKAYRYPPEQLSKLFDSLILSIFTYGIQVWGAAYHRKDRERIDRFFKRAARFGYTKRKITISELISQHDNKLFKQISSNKQHILKDLLPEKRTRPLRNRTHNFILPCVKTERFKQCFINRCLFK